MRVANEGKTSAFEDRITEFSAPYLANQAIKGEPPDADGHISIDITLVHCVELITVKTAISKDTATNFRSVDTPSSIWRKL